MRTDTVMAGVSPAFRNSAAGTAASTLSCLPAFLINPNLIFSAETPKGFASRQADATYSQLVRRWNLAGGSEVFLNQRYPRIIGAVLRMRVSNAN